MIRISIHPAIDIITKTARRYCAAVDHRNGCIHRLNRDGFPNVDTAKAAIDATFDQEGEAFKDLCTQVYIHVARAEKATKKRGKK